MYSTSTDRLVPGLIPCNDPFELRDAAEHIDALGRRAGEALVGAVGDYDLLPDGVEPDLFAKLKPLDVMQLAEIVAAVMSKACIETSGGHAYGDPAHEWLAQALVGKASQVIR
jgi:hypothetical protein